MFVFVQQCGRKTVLKLMEFPVWLLDVQHGDKSLSFKSEMILSGRTTDHEMMHRKEIKLF